MTHTPKASSLDTEGGGDKTDGMAREIMKISSHDVSAVQIYTGPLVITMLLQ